jgi:hypothetical protein
MTEQKPFIAFTPLTESQRACVDLLTEALAEAQKGHVSSVGIVVCMSTGFATVMAGHQAADLYLGCGDLMHKIHGAVTSGNVKKKVPPSIVLARPS